MSSENFHRNTIMIICNIFSFYMRFHVHSKFHENVSLRHHAILSCGMGPSTGNSDMSKAVHDFGDFIYEDSEISVSRTRWFTLVQEQVLADWMK